MSRAFNGTTAYLTRGDRLGTSAWPMSFFCWFNATTYSGSNRGLFFMGADANGQNDLLALVILTTGKIELSTRDPVNSYIVAETAATVTTDTWQSASFTMASDTSRAVYLNGANKGTSTSTSGVTFANMNRTSLGAYTQNSVIAYLSGQIAHAAVWDTALTDTDHAVLASGLLPTRVKPTSLRAYWSLSGKDSPEIDIAGRNDLTVTNATVGASEPIVYRQYAF